MADTITRRAFLRTTSFASVAHCLPALPQTLYSQSLQAQLARSNPKLEVLVQDLRTRQTLADTFAPTPILPGSLLKPFLALAYLASPHPPLHAVCRGHADQCWRAHGTLTLPEALAQSCNAYFLALACTLDPAEIALPTFPPPNPTPEDLIGLTPRWLIPPQTLAAAYAQFLSNPSTPRAILEGMRLCTEHGTASALGPQPGGALAKTGTAPCIPGHEPCKADGDGLVLVAVPVASPILLLLVRRRATNGATAAGDAARVLAQIKALHAY
jgi:cell division protein FtsI/penicillin-binding protein 2